MIRRWAWVLSLGVVLAAPAAWADQESAIQTVRNHPKILDVKVDTTGNLYAIVKPENAAWAQYASYLCQVITPHQARIFKVRIIDVTKAVFSLPPGKWQKLAEANCAQ